MTNRSDPGIPQRKFQTLTNKRMTLSVLANFAGRFRGSASIPDFGSCVVSFSSFSSPPPPSPPLWSSKILTKIFIEKNKKIFQTDKNDLNGKLGSDIQCIKNPLRIERCCSSESEKKSRSQSEVWAQMFKSSPMCGPLNVRSYFVTRRFSTRN